MNALLPLSELETIAMGPRKFLIAFLILILTPASAFAGKADVIDVKISKESSGTFNFAVTLKSDETGWEKYADKWEVLPPDDKILGTRTLLHPHEAELPFTRSLGGVKIPASITSVRVRAHDKVEGYGGKELTVEVPH